MPVVLAACLGARAAAADDFEEKRFHVIPFAGFTFFDDDRRFLTDEDLPTGGYFGGRANARLSCLFLLEVAGGATPVETCCDWMDWGHVSANLVWSPATARRFSPFVSLGGGWSRTKHSVGDAQELGTYEGAVGFNAKLSNTLGLRFEARDVLASSPDHFNDVVLGMGLNIGLGETVECGGEEYVEAEQPAPPPVVEAPPPPAPEPTPQPEAEQHELPPIDKGAITMRNLYFPTGGSEIGWEEARTLEEMCTILKQRPDLEIEISGHSDSRERPSLSHRRAEAVLEWFRANCPEANLDNLSAQGYGDERPIGSNRSVRGRHLNRRVEFRVLNPEVLKSGR
jgi:OOP family OmpA-OmpF porin